MEKVTDNQPAETDEPNDMPETVEAVEEPAEEPSRVRRGTASDLRGRGSHSLNKVMQATNKLMGLTEDEDETAEPAAEPAPVAAKPETPAREVLIGRGGWAAIALLVVVLPLTVWAIWNVLQLNDSVAGYRTNIASVQNGVPDATTLADLLESPNLRHYSMQSADPSPLGTAQLHIGGPQQMLLTTRRLSSIAAQNRIFVLYLVRNTPNPGPSDYIALATIANGQTQNQATLINPAVIPADFSAKNYSRFIITDEPNSQSVTGKPVGPVRFTLNVADIK